MKLKERLSYFWNVTLGEDYPEMENIEESNDPKYAELKESLERVNAMENRFKKPASGKKSGKDGIVKSISVDEKVAVKVAETKKENKEQSKEIEEK